MTRKKKQESQQTIDLTLQGGPLGPITVSSVEDSTLPVKPLSGGAAGYIVRCETCNAEIWVYSYDDNLVYLCSSCADIYDEQST